MELRIRIIDEQLCKVHFSISYREASKRISQFIKTACIDNEAPENLLYNFLEKDVLENELYCRGVVPVGEKQVRYLSPFTVDKPVIGIATFVIMTEVTNIAFPVSISTYVYANIKKVLSDCDNMFREKLIENSLCYYEAVDMIDENSIVNYQLLYTKNGVILNTIKNQTFDLMIDEDMEPERFLNAKINDRIIIDQGEVTIEALITSIERKVPYSKDKHDIEDIVSMGYLSFEDLYQKFCEAYDYIMQIDTYIDFIIEFICEHSSIKVNDAVMEFYEKRDYFPFAEEYFEDDSEEVRRKVIAKAMVFDLLLKMIDIKGDKPILDKETKRKLIQYHKYLGMQNEVIDAEMNIELLKAKLLKYCKMEKIIKGIIIEL